MLSQAAFLEGMNLLGEQWPNILKTSRLARYYEMVKDLTAEEFTALVNKVLDQCVHQPVPHEVREVAQALINSRSGFVDPYADRPDPRDDGGLEAILARTGAKDLVGAIEIMKNKKLTP